MITNSNTVNTTTANKAILIAGSINEDFLEFAPIKLLPNSKIPIPEYTEQLTMQFLDNNNNLINSINFDAPETCTLALRPDSEFVNSQIKAI